MSNRERFLWLAFIIATVVTIQVLVTVVAA
jgi:hypothetical protein